jgi:ribosome-associated toxin RatA of RatAB toxin-antitoxin module
MHTATSILIKAPMHDVFDMTTDLIRWPALLPHYRWVRRVEGNDEHGVVEMAAMRGSIPIRWTSEFRRDRQVNELWFKHLTAFTKGMEVNWSYVEKEAGVHVTISHELNFRWPPLAPLANPLIGDFMIGWVAPRTLASFKELLEMTN